ncbi:cytochrome c oxidase subunit II [Planctomycetota bacterium]|nr:cytochrome c oxidase subunit II [Planctomycetota bacterium]
MSLIDGISTLSGLPLAQSGGGGSFWFPVQASTVAEGHDFVFNFILIVCTIFFVGIIGATLYFVVKYRKRPRHKEERTATHNTRLEIAWSLGPLVILMIMFGMSTYWYMQMVSPPVSDNTLEVRGTAWKWDWKFEYFKDGKKYTCKNFHCVVGRPVEVTCTSNDVLHSLFFAPMRVKQDIVPGRFSRVYFTPTVVSPPPLVHSKSEKDKWTEEQKWELGDDNNPNADLGGWMLYCTEYCGDKHSLMRARIYVYETEDEMWANIAREGDIENYSGAEQGEMLWEINCKSCHSTSDAAEWTSLGPNWGAMYGTRDLESGDSLEVTDENILQYVSDSVRTPEKEVVTGAGTVMPPFGKSSLSDENIANIVEFIKKINGKEHK